MDKTFKDWLLQQMLQRDLSQSDLARLTGLSRQAISYYTTGRSKLSRQEDNKIIKQIAHLAADLPDDEQQDILEFVKLRHRLSEERGTYETKRTNKKSTATK